MPDSALLKTLKAQSALLKVTPDSKELEDTIITQLEKSHYSNFFYSSHYSIEERIDIYEETIRSRNRYALEWLLQKAQKEKSLGFRFRYKAGADYSYEELSARRIGDGFNGLTTPFADLLFSHPDAGHSGPPLSNEDKQETRRCRKMIDEIQLHVDPANITPFLPAFSQIAATTNNLYFFERLNPDYQFIESYFFTALLAAAKSGSVTLLDHWLAIGRQKTFTAAITNKDIPTLFETGLKSHVSALINHLDADSKVLLLNGYVRHASPTAAELEAFIATLQVDPKTTHPALTEAYQYIAYCLSLGHVKCFMKKFGVLADKMTPNNLPECKEFHYSEAVARTRLRLDYEAIQRFHYVLDFLDGDHFPYEKDETILKILHDLTAEDMADLLAIVTNEEAYKAHTGYLVEWRQAEAVTANNTASASAPPPYLVASTLLTPEAPLALSPFALFGTQALSSRDDEIKQMCQLLMMTTNKLQPFPHVLEMRQYVLAQLEQLIGETTVAEEKHGVQLK